MAIGFFTCGFADAEVAPLTVTFFAASEAGVLAPIFGAAFQAIVPRFGPPMRCTRALAGTLISNAMSAREILAVLGLYAMGSRGVPIAEAGEVRPVSAIAERVTSRLAGGLGPTTRRADKLEAVFFSRRQLACLAEVSSDQMR